MTTTDHGTTADAYAHARELHARVQTTRAAAADAIDQLRAAQDQLPSLTRRTLDRLLTSIVRQLADAERVAHPVNVGHARLVDAIGPNTDDQAELLTTELAPWQRKLADAALSGERVELSRGRRG